MADKYIWHNTSWKELANWAKYFGYKEDVTLTDPTAQDYVSLCNLLGVASLGNSVTIIFRDTNKWYIKGPLTITFKENTNQLHIKSRNDKDTRTYNISIYSFEDNTEEGAIKEFNFTTRLKEEGYGYVEEDVEIFPLKNTWNNRSTLSIEENGIDIQPNAKDIDQNVLFPFRGIKQCFIPNYFNSDDGTQGSINGAVFDGSLLDPLNADQPIGQPLDANFKKFSPGFGFDSDVTIKASGGESGLVLKNKKDTSKMWNMCLYPLVLMDETSRKHPNMKIILKKNAEGKNTVQVVDGNTAITIPIEVNPEIDYLVAYTQEHKPPIFNISILNQGGVACSNLNIPSESTEVLWERDKPEVKGNTTHIYADAELFLQIDLKESVDNWVTRVFPWDDKSFGNNGIDALTKIEGIQEPEGQSLNEILFKGKLTSYWKEIKKLDQHYRMFENLFNCIPNNLTNFVSEKPQIKKWEGKSQGEQPGYNTISLSSKEAQSITQYITRGKNPDPGYVYESGKSNLTDTTTIENTDCCSGCYSVVFHVKAYACTAATNFIIEGKKKWNNEDDYIKYLDYWFGEKKQYWLGENEKVGYEFPIFYRIPKILMDSIDIAKETENKWTGKLENTIFNLYLKNFYGCSHSQSHIQTKDDWYITLNYNELNGTCSLGFENATMHIKGLNDTYSMQENLEDKVIVLWTHKLPDGNLAATTTESEKNT